jgi:TPR repeat protein
VLPFGQIIYRASQRSLAIRGPMTTPSDTHPFRRSTVRSFLVLLATLASMSALGCARGELSVNRVQVSGLSYDAQESVETAFRRHPDPEAVSEAIGAFSKACDAGDAGACSAVGVMYELGLDVPLDTRRARRLYSFACEAHNARACENLAALMAADTSDFYDRVATLQP